MREVNQKMGAVIKHIKFCCILFAICIGNFSCHTSKNIRSHLTTFSHLEKQLIDDGKDDTPMRVYKITNRSDSIILRTACEDVNVKSKDPLLAKFVKRLYATVRDSMSLGVGIAAPQVGVLKNIIWVQRFDKEGFPFEEYLNPRILQYSKKTQSCREGCLSIPNRSDTTFTRSYAILIEYDRLDGSHEVEIIEDFTAVIFQHEVDHLHGILYLDRLDEPQATDN